MNLLLTLHLLEDRLAFPQGSFSSEGVPSFDIDNFSDDLTVGTAIKAIQQSGKVAVLINADFHGSLGAILKVLNTLARVKNPVLLIHNGGHPIIQNMLKRFDARSVLNDQPIEEARRQVLAFFNLPT